MKLSYVRDSYEALSAKASEIARQLSLAGIAVVWVFKSGTDQAPKIDQHLLRAALFIVVALSLDFLQYLIGTTTWFIYFRKKENEVTQMEDEIRAPAWFNWPTWIFFYLKSLSLVIAYGGYLIPFLFWKFFAR
jgi:hypothetical protein